MTNINWEQKYAELQFVHQKLKKDHETLRTTHNELLATHKQLEEMYLTERHRSLRPDDPDDYWRITMDNIERRLKIVELQSEILLRNLSHGRTIDYGRFSTACSTIAAPYTDQSTDRDNK